MKTKEELDALKEEVETLNKKLTELSEEELAQITGGAGGEYRDKEGHIHFAWQGPTDTDNIHIDVPDGPKVIFTPTEGEKYTLE